MRPADDRPNVILINCDDLGYGDLGCYGSTVNKTPHLDRMASEGMRLTDFYMSSPICSPSRGSMMTGCYPPRIGFDTFRNREGERKAAVLFPGFPDGLAKEEITVADLLKRQGYATKLVGKWHCGDQPEFLPTAHGFDSYFGIPYSNDMGIQASNPDGTPLPLMEDERPIQLQPDQRSITERYVEHSVRFIRENRDEPFFLYLAHMHVHLPHYPPERFLRQSINGPYGAAVECIDWAAGAILDELKRQGLDDNTLVIFTSDNGSRGDRGGSNRPLRGAKGTCWEGGQRVPCIARWPGKVPAGSTCDQTATAMDFLPTFTELAGGRTPADRTIDGHDIRPLLLGDDGAATPYDAFFYYRMHQLNAVRSGPWKLLVPAMEGPDGGLYNLVDDPGERNNLIHDHPDVVERLNGMLQQCREDLGDSRIGVEGANRRPVGHVENPVPLAYQDEDYPYIVAMYDLPDRG